MRRAILGALVWTMATSSLLWAAPPESIPLYEDLGTLHRDVSTTSEEAQAYFDQGLMLAYAFGRSEAVSSFREAQERDPECAMCSWGEAWALGPYINEKMRIPAARDAYLASRRAQKQAEGATDVERALIDAMTKRYAADPEAAEREELDLAYADAMREVAHRFPDDQDVQSLFAEALMVLHPWDLYPDGEVRPEAEEAIEVLEGVLEANLRHGGACHLYIHAVEPSADPGRAEACADVLASTIPGGSHIHHMPSHIYMRIGRYEDSVHANRRAWLTDQRADRGEAVSIYPGHNVHMMWFAAWMDGQSGVALQAARDMERMGHWAFGIEPLTLARFGRWQEALETPKPKEPLDRGMWHYSRGMASLRLGDMPGAEKELKRLDKIVARTDPDKTFFPGAEDGPIHFLWIAQGMLAGEIAVAEGDYDEAIRRLEKVAEVEDHLEYSEPEIWPIPARQVLGAVYLAADRPGDARRAYEEELEHHPENGWSLYGLAEALRQQGDEAAAAEVEERFAKAWERSDMVLPGSRF